MSFRAVDMSGCTIFFGDGALKPLFHQHAARRIRDAAVRAEALRRVLDHEFLRFDPWGCAEERERHRRAKSCRERIAGLKPLLSADKIQFVGLEGTTGSPKLTIAILTGHSLKYLDIDKDRLLLSVERHPSGQTLVQYWLYSRTERTLRLLREHSIVQEAILTGPPKVFRDGSWQVVDGTRENDFLLLIETYFGGEVRKAIEKAFRPQESGLISHTVLPEDVLDEIKELTQIDLRANENAESEARRTKYLAKYGPQEETVKPGIYFVPDAGIRLGMAKPDPPPLPSSS